jgi:D-alanyl-D-alanine carboxypeptidase (penicillin-binding protein 5/6)
VKPRLPALVALCCLVTGCQLAIAARPAAAASPLADVAATSFLVENAATGEVLAARNADARVPIASITKLMTVLVTLEHAKLTDVVRVDRAAAEVGESSIPLRPGDRLTVRDLIEAALIQSANNAADALALHVAGSYPAFARLMNEKAAELGLDGTHFVRPDGLDTPGHVSTARDVTKLARVAMRLPFVRATVRKTSDTIAGGRVLHTWNDLLYSFPRLIGVKTGHTSGAGWSEVAAARGRGTTIYATILGSPDRARRNSDLTSLLAYGIAQYTVVQPVRAKHVYATVALPYGRRPVALVAQAPLRRVVRAGRPLVERVVAARAVALPVRKGQRLGTVTVSSRGRVIARRPLVAARSVARPGLAARIGWHAKRTARHLVGWLT